jgi:endoglucanase
MTNNSNSNSQKLLRLFIAFMFVLLMTPNSFSAFFKTQGDTILDTQGQPILLRGVGLGGWLVPEGYMLHTPGFGSPSSIRAQFEGLIGAANTDQFFELYRANYVNEQDIKIIADLGYNSIRLPFHYNLFYNRDSSKFIEAGFTLLDNFLDWCRQYNLYVILDMHCAPGGQNAGNISDSDGEEARLWTNSDNQDLTVLIWTEIASRYANEELIIGYDLLNEPVLPSGYSNNILKSFYIRLIYEIRQVDTNHIVFIEGNNWATDFNLLTPPLDYNMVYAFHKYWSETTVATIQNMLDIRTLYNVPLWMGESGENSNPWFYETIHLLEQNDIGWNWWTHKKIATTTSPYSAPLTENYQTVLDYLDGNTTKPSVEFAKNALLEMAENLAIDKCEYHPDVVAALFDGQYNTVSKPYQDLKIPGTIDAVNYDIGNNGLAYRDSDYKRIRWDVWQPWNSGGAYRNDGVDIEAAQDAQGAAYNVGWITNGEWIKYTINSEITGFYRVSLRVASSATTGRLNVEIDNQTQFSNLAVPNTGGWQNWQWLDAGDIELSTGSHELRLYFVQEGFNINQIKFSLLSSAGFEKVNSTFFCGKNYPNPFNGLNTIPIVLPNPTRVKISVYDNQGKLIRTVIDGNLPEGLSEIRWDGRNSSGDSVASGQYFYLLDVNDKQITRKMILLR